MREKLLTHGINLNATAASEHIPDIERKIRVIKERAQALRSKLLFKIIPGRMIIEMITNVVLWINAFPPSSGVSKKFSPRTIMTGTALDFNKNCHILFGAYAKVHEDNTITKTMNERTQPAICVGPTANFQGSYKFLSLKTEKTNRSEAIQGATHDRLRYKADIGNGDPREAGQGHYILQ
jgi:hypothetical protein